VSLSKFISIAFIALIACSSNFSLDNFNSDDWIADKNGCEMKRVGLVEDLVNRKEDLFGHGQKDIIAVLGKPNRHELYSRNKKAFVYYVSGGSLCSKAEDSQEKLVIRFDGIGRAKEVIYYKN
jgi:hypothetical protein